MKKLIPLIIALVTMLGATAQSHRFADSTAQWSLLTSNLLGEYYATTQFRVMGDTTINGINYQKINSDIFIRKDTSEKVYVLYGDTCEQLIYDFEPAIGDTFATHTCANNPDQLVTCRIDSIDSIFIGRQRKAIHVSYQSTYIPSWVSRDIWVEGIGSLHSQLTFPGSSSLYIDGNGYHLLCYFENAVRLYHDSNTYYQNVIKQNSYMNACDRSEFIFLGISDIPKLSHIIYPNPSSSSITITLSQQPQPGTVMHIYNAIGALVKQEDLTTSTQQINVAELADGIYTYAITQQGVRQASGKLVVSH